MSVCVVSIVLLSPVCFSPPLPSHPPPNSATEQSVQKSEKPGGPPVMGLFDNPTNPAVVKSSTPLFPSRSPERQQVRESLTDTRPHVQACLNCLLMTAAELQCHPFG